MPHRVQKPTADVEHHAANVRPLEDIHFVVIGGVDLRTCVLSMAVADAISARPKGDKKWKTVVRWTYFW